MKSDQEITSSWLVGSLTMAERKRMCLQAGEDLSSPGSVSIGSPDSYLGLLGIHWGQFPEYWQISSEGTVVATEGQRDLVVEGQYIKGVSGMTCVAPAWAILEALNHPMIQSIIEQRERQALASQAKGPVDPMPG